MISNLASLLELINSYVGKITKCSKKHLYYQKENNNNNNKHDQNEGMPVIPVLGMFVLTLVETVPYMSSEFSSSLSLVSQQPG